MLLRPRNHCDHERFHLRRAAEKPHLTINCAFCGQSTAQKYLPSVVDDLMNGSIRKIMREILKFFVLLMAVCVIAVAASLVLPSPDGSVFACAVLLSAIAVTLIICSDLSRGRINQTGDIMRAIEHRHSLRLTIAAYLLGCSMVASATVLIYRLIGHW
ncbi:ABC-type transport system involved in multi-copper enzyme maturation [Pseudomonas syringae pv. actinidiae]|uniref:ABC-type transport system involved in multi-copper enzyme maturation n=5 Tax=Pseudomonas syringae group TaxID=136849 RepID=A0A2V0QGT4_PSESF|nr:ABC-type transport system involved in multi-copper enzyme maturation [Pseudomonas syringae pv. actinidiae]